MSNTPVTNHCHRYWLRLGFRREPDLGHTRHRDAIDAAWSGDLWRSIQGQERGAAIDWEVEVEAKPALDVAVAMVTFQPGGHSGWHSHPGPVFISVVAGEMTFYEADDPSCAPVVRHAGQGFLDTGAHAHIARNETTAPATNVVTRSAGQPSGRTHRTPGIVRFDSGRRSTCQSMRTSIVEVSMAKRLLFCASPVLLIVMCTASKMPTEPTSHTVESGALAHVGHADSASADTAAEGNPSSGAHDDKEHIDGWFNGQRVQRTTPRLSSVRNRQTAARAPAASSAPTPKRRQDRGQFPPSTPSRPPVVFNRLWTRSRAPRDGLSQSPAHDRCDHALADQRTDPPWRTATSSASMPAAGSTRSTFAFAMSTSGTRSRPPRVWIRCASQADPIIGVSGQRLISADTPTNIFFFIASWRPAQSSVVS